MTFGNFSLMEDGVEERNGGEDPHSRNLPHLSFPSCKSIKIGLSDCNRRRFWISSPPKVVMRIAPRLRSFIFFNSSSPPYSLPCTHRSLACSSMAGTEESLSADRFGFTRDEMYSTTLAGTVDRYDRHLFLCYKSPAAWNPRVEADSLPNLLVSALKKRKNEILLKTKMTVCEGEESDGDVLIFPEMTKYKGLTDSDVNGFVEDVLVNAAKSWTGGVCETLSGSYIFVCAHASRDKRCGICGPALIEKLKQEVELRGLKDRVFVRACSHVGGHKYAGNLIVFSTGSDGKTIGHWYGYVTPDDVPELLDLHIKKGLIIERIWRGQMGGYQVGKRKQSNVTGAEETKKLEDTRWNINS